VGGMKEFRIKDESFDLAIYHGNTAAEALAAFLADMVGAAVREDALNPDDYKVAQYGDGKTVAPGKGDAYERIEIEWAA
jgi:hypothetical protein